MDTAATAATKALCFRSKILLVLRLGHVFQIVHDALEEVELLCEFSALRRPVVQAIADVATFVVDGDEVVERRSEKAFFSY